MVAPGHTGLQTELAGESVTLLPERALFWPVRRTLVIADPHFGKASVFRRRGIPLPGGGTAADLARLAALITAHAPERLLILGDFLHATPTSDEPWLQTFSDWRQRHAELMVQIVAGNHDRGRDGLPGAWRLDWHAPDLRDGPFAFRHEPEPVPGRHVLAGHLHPVLRLRGPTDRLRMPVFWFGEAVSVLPSFGAFTGGHAIEPMTGERVFGVGPDRVVDCSPAARGRRQSARRIP